MDQTNMVFSPVGNHSVAEKVVSQFEELIIHGILREGMKLPPERELATLMEVSRDKLREAMAALEQADLIISRKGDGTYIAALTGTALSPAMLALCSRHPKVFTDYLEFRRHIEGFVSELAANRATNTDKKIIQACLDQQRTALENNDREATLKADIAFHASISDAAHNAIVTHNITSIHDLTEAGIFYNREAMRKVQDADETLLLQHNAIAEAIFN
ncbi:MAG: FadR/GntR family transcriptional regulator, partial [Hyphomicrobiales bacterium]